MATITLAGGKSFIAEPNEAILEAAMRCGIVLEHSCKSGRCTSCKARVKKGATTALFDELGLTQEERDHDWILTCARSAESDAELDVQDIGDFKLFPAKTLPCRIKSISHVNADVMNVVLRFPPNQKLEYRPGQYVDVIAKGGLRRSYSIANAPRPDQQIELHIKRVPGGAMSRYWFDEARENDLLRVNGPLGTFFLRDVAGVHLILLATGTGIAPIKALLEELASTKIGEAPSAVSVYWGGRVSQDLYWDPKITGVNLDYVPALSREGDSWQGVRGHVQDAVLNAGFDLGKSAVYACGSFAMIESSRAQLVAAGLDGHQFYSDAFVSST